MKHQINRFVDGLIETLNNEFNDTTVKTASPRREKVNYLKKLSQELDVEYSDHAKFFDLIKKNQEELLSLNLGKKEPFVPKPDLKFAEYNFIKDFFNPADFERNSFLSMSLPFVSATLWFI